MLQTLARHRRWLFLAALVLLFAALGVRYTFKALHDRGAISRWRPQLQQLDTEDISAKFNYPNPPVMAVLLEPLALMPPVPGALLWFALKAAMAVVSLYWAFRLVEYATQQPFPDWAKALTVLLCLKPIVDDLNHGNVNIFILFLVMASLTAYHSRRDLVAGLILALAISCKVTPALFVFYFAWKRQWRVLIACLAGMALFLYPGLLPAMRLGWDDNIHQLASWYDGMVRPFVVEGRVTSEHINQSLPGVAFRLLTHSPSFVTWVNDVETPARYDNVMSLSPAEVKWLVKGCMGLFALLFVAFARTPGRTRKGWRVAAELALVMLGMLMFSERTWKHHCVTLVLPIAVVCYAISTCEGWWARRGLIASLAVASLLMFLTGLGGGTDRAAAAQSPGLAKLALVYGAYLWAWLALLLALVAMLASRRASQAAGGVSSTEQPAALAA